MTVLCSDRAAQRVDEALRKAWLALRHDHPTIAARAETDTQASLQKTLIHVSTGQTAEEWANSDPSCLPALFQHSALVPGRHQRTALTLSQAQTSQLLALCKKVGATPTHPFQAAAVIVMRDVQDSPAEAKRVQYVNYFLRNERSSCVEPYSTAKHPVALYHSVSGGSLVVEMTLSAAGDVPDEKSRKEEFHTIVEAMKDFYHGVRNDKEHYSLSPSMLPSTTPPLPPSPRPLPCCPSSKAASICLHLQREAHGSHCLPEDR
ncbi:hypothetical protein BKA56DRAFT_611917 [Ilyonectria sp. MPI-CAGE-AT-0026]|nr:hypothetical protein BKA56DRAFT_611917 [Ilyonectria sp. MPI-CAGE-AT-0026]